MTTRREPPRAAAGDAEPTRRIIFPLFRRRSIEPQFFKTEVANNIPVPPTSDGDYLFLCPGDKFIHFEIVEEIGHGSFARVYLAKQESLAQRLVVLKVSTGKSDEPQKLARLQHANIVPVYSIHALATAEAICMPYLGRVTLSQLMYGFGRDDGSRPANGRELLAPLIDDRPDQKQRRMATCSQCSNGCRCASRRCGSWLSWPAASRTPINGASSIAI